ncbi:MAG: HNH endonuclease [Caldilineaceae bacterium]|nr:HNH endonuclease [Caldilineaceae bacterium]
MSREHIPVAVRRLVAERAQGRCEYCLLHQDDTPFTHPLDHIIAIRHGGATTTENLALACIDCNQNKGADLTTLDPLTGEITPLFHPRHHDWNEHFQLEGALIRGRTATGRATVALLRINELSRVEERQLLLSIDRYPS